MQDLPTENPHAFPLSDPNSVYNEGMTLRDYFAAKSVLGFMTPYMDREDDFINAARKSYKMADTMLKERSKNGEQ